MKYEVHEKFIDVEDLEDELKRLKSLLTIIHNNYFGYSEEWMQKNKSALVHDYSLYGDLTSVSLSLVHDAMETASILKHNIR